MLWTAVHASAQPARLFRVAWVSTEQAGTSPLVLAAFRAGLSDLGYTEGRNLIIDAWWGDAVRLEQLRPDILRARPEVIVAQGGIALGPMRHASVNVPVLFSMSADPVLAGIVGSYARPGGNVTGITLFTADLIGKRMAMLTQLLPNLRSVAVLANPSHPGAQRELQVSRDAAARLKLELSFYPASNPAAVDTALAEVAAKRIGALLVLSDGFALAQAERIAEFSKRESVPVIAGWASFAQQGNLMAYGPEFSHVYRRLASYAPHSQGRQAGRSSRGTADQIRIRHQSEDSQGPWPDSATRFAIAGHRCDRVRWRLRKKGVKCSQLRYSLRRAEPAKDPRWSKASAVSCVHVHLIKMRSRENLSHSKTLPAGGDLGWSSGFSNLGFGTPANKLHLFGTRSPTSA
jgi:putative ABC transport system substrate-binding protein